MTHPLDPLATVRPLVRTRQVRQFTADPLTDAQLQVAQAELQELNAKAGN